MEFKIDLPSNLNKLDNFKNLLEKYRDYKSCIREVKLNTLLGQKCLFEIEDFDPPLLIDFSSDAMTTLSNTAGIIEKLSFKINTDFEIIELNLKLKPFDNKMGKLIFELQSYGINLEIKPKVIKYGLDSNLQAVGFYFDNSGNTYIRA